MSSSPPKTLSAPLRSIPLVFSVAGPVLCVVLGSLYSRVLSAFRIYIVLCMRIYRRSNSAPEGAKRSQHIYFLNVRERRSREAERLRERLLRGLGVLVLARQRDSGRLRHVTSIFSQLTINNTDSSHYTGYKNGITIALTSRS